MSIFKDIRPKLFTEGAHTTSFIHSMLDPNLGCFLRAPSPPLLIPSLFLIPGHSWRFLRVMVILLL